MNRTSLTLAPLLEIQLAAALRSNSEDAQRRVGRALSKQYLEGIVPEQALLIFEALCWKIDEVKIKVLKRSSPTDGSNFVMAVMSGTYASTISDIDDGRLDRLENVAHNLEREQSARAWMYPKYNNLFAYIRHRLKALDFVENVISSSAASNIDYATAAQFVPPAQILAELIALRKYGLKSCFFRDGMLQAPGHSWVFIDPMEYRAVINGRRQYQPSILTSIHLAPTEELQDLAAKPNHKESDFYEVHGVKFGFNSSLEWTLDERGSLDYSCGMNISPLEDVFRQRGRPELYQSVLLSQVLRLYDLLVPIEKVRQLPQLNVQEPITPGFLRQIVGRRSVPLSVADLVLPRVRLLDNPQALIDGMEQELEEAEHVTRTRMQREHEVVGHVRRLPPGRIASPDARMHAMDAHIELAEGETFVRMHKRGKGDPITAHRAVERRQ